MFTSGINIKIYLFMETKAQFYKAYDYIRANQILFIE